MTHISVARQLGELVSRTSYPDIGEVALDAAKVRILDAIGIMVAGVDRSAFDAAKRYLALAGLAPQEHLSGGGTIADLLPQREESITPSSHGFLLGAAAFIDNYGDTSLHSVVHPNTIIVPAALAAARERPMSGEAFLTAVVVGYQVAEVLGRTLNDGAPRMAHQVRGFRPTSSCGPAGVAAAVGRGWGLDEDSVVKSIALACNLGSGLRRTDLGELAHMRLHSGEVVNRGFEAIVKSQAGITVDEAFIEGDGGFYQAYSSGELGHPNVIPRSSDDWHVTDVALKLHATPHTLAAGLDCLLEYVRENPDSVERIESAIIHLPAAHAAISLSAAEVDVTTLSATEALDSLPFCAACVIHSGEVVLPELSERFIRDPKVLNLAKSILVRSDPELSTVFNRDSGSWPVRVELIVAGETVNLARQRPRGVDVTPDVRTDLRRKFDALSERAWSHQQRAQVVDFVEHMQTSRDVYSDLRALAIGK